jgi:pyochelin synthetase
LLQTVLEEVVGLAPQGRKIRILEIGAGFGITTVYLLPCLPADLTEYVYTDISPYFLQEAEAKFAAYPNVSYGLLDIEQDPHTQGYDWHDFDIVIASNVLHATARIAETLRHIRSLLKPHGLLLLLEATRFSPLLDLTMGLQQGMDRFEDTELRPSHPLLTRDLWHEVLKKGGFTASVILNRPGTLTNFFGFDVMLAEAPEEVSPLRLRELYEQLRSQLPEYLVPWRIIPLEALPLTANGKVDRQALPHPFMPSQEQTRSGSVARTPTEQRLVQLWRELLELSHVGREENFLELGGDSLLATKLLSAIQANFNVEVPFRVLFKNPTIAALAEAIEQGQGHGQGQAAVPTTMEEEEEEGVL